MPAPQEFHDSSSSTEKYSL